MREVPAFGGRFRVVPVPGAGAMLLSEDEVQVLPGSAYARVVPLVDGRRHSDEVLAAAIARGVDPGTAAYVLAKLDEGGYLIEGRAQRDPDSGAFWRGLGVDPAEAEAGLAASRVRVFAGGSTTTAESMQRALARCGIPARTPGADEATGGTKDDFDVVVADDYLSEALLEIDERARALGRRWMLVRPAGFECWIGPVFEPGRTGCLHCLRQRLGRYRAAHRFAARLEPEHGTATPLPAIAATRELACQLAAVEAARAVAGTAADLTGIVLTMELASRSTKTHRLTRNPECSACGTGPNRDPAPVRLAAAPAATTAGEGGYRTVPPEETLDRYGHVVSPITGIVETLDAVPTGRDVGCVCLGPQQMRVGYDGNGTVQLRRHGSGGKGATSAAARASALGEAIERYSFERHGGEATIAGTFNELAPEAIHPNEVMNFSDRQYRERVARNRATGSGRRFIPEPLDPDTRIDWTAVWSLTGERRRLLPTELLYARTGPPEPTRGPRYCVTCSNGCAAGNTLEEAVLQGLLETIERDAVAVWWYNRLRPTEIDLDSFDDPWLSKIETEYEQWNRQVVALDLTHDLGIPVIGAVSHVRAGAAERILLGFGCHVDAGIAARRAVSEMAQMLIVDLGLAGHQEDREHERWMQSATRAHQWQLTGDETRELRKRDEFPAAPADRHLKQAIERCLEAVESRGLEVLVLDRTRADVGMPAVKVIVPGLRHFWPRFGPGRLYDVPVATGMRRTPLSEDELNPVAFFI